MRMGMHRAANLINLGFFAILEVFLRAQCYYDHHVILARMGMNRAANLIHLVFFAMLDVFSKGTVLL